MTNEELKQVLESPKRNSMTAKEAKDKADKIFEGIENLEIDTIIPEIDKAASQGRYNIVVKTLYRKTVEKLTKLGYKLEDNSHYGIMIRWD